MDAAERDLFAGSLRRAFETYRGADLDAALVDLGWRDALASDREDAVSALFEIQGATNATSGALADVLRAGLGLDGTGAVVLPAAGSWRAPGRLVGGVLTVRGLGDAGLADPPSVLVVAVDESDTDVAVEISPADLVLRPVHGMDPRLRLLEITGDVVPVPAPRSLAAAAWSNAVALAQLALGHELIGASRHMLELARTHALERTQFGQPISAFQAVRHRLADALVAIEAAQSLLTSAWQDPSAERAAMAKAQCGRTAHTVARHCQQVLAGIGFTTEHPLHLDIRRVLVLDQLFGTAASLSRDIGSRLRATRQLMALPPL